ncbi:MAG: amino acid adenylation domain-containing protein [Hydrococcus sp. Prado102]|nr:amino acid adenylation domain-containing protein [Hydrococcus sp. Prado102]
MKKNNNIEDAYPLSPMQQGMLFHSIYAPKTGIYIGQVDFELRGQLNVFALIQAWEEVIKRHPVLRTACVWENLQQPIQVVVRQVKIPWQEQDWREISPLQQQAKLKALLEKDIHEDFEFSKAPLIRLTLIRLSETTYHFIWTYHLLLFDGWSLPLIYKEVFHYYQAFCQGQNVYLEKPRPYKDYIAWLQQQKLYYSEIYWREILKNCTVTSISNNKKSLSEQRNHYTKQAINLSAIATDSLSSFAKKHQITLNTLVQGAWALLLSKYTGEEDIIFGVTVSGRPHTLAKANSIVGLFINTLPIRVKISDRQSLIAWLQQIQERQIEARQYEYTPLVDIQRWSEIPANIPLFESIVVFENYPVEKIALKESGLDLEIKICDRFERSNYPLTVIAIPGNELLLEIAYEENKGFDDTTIYRMLKHLETLLQAMVVNPQQCLKELSILTEAEKQQLLVEWNNTTAHYPQEQCIHQLFEKQVECTPDNIAIVFEDRQITYRELNDRANQLARYLQKQGVKPDVLVGICVEPTIEMIVGLLGILKAGGAYLPLDPTYPKERLQYMLSDAEVTLIVTTEKCLNSLPSHQAKIICLDSDWEVIAKESKENTTNAIALSNLAYIIYTSGSTGKPKGVLVTHYNVVRLFAATQDCYNFNQNDVWTLFHSYAFDFSVWEIWGALLYGGRLAIVPYWISRTPEAFYELLKTEKVTVLNQTPSAFKQLIEVEESLNPSEDLSLRLVIFGGEALELQSLKPWFARHSDSHPQLINMYGITETTVHVTYRPITMADLDASVSVIGRPIKDLNVYLLDRNLQPVPIGVTGEMYISGAGVSRGYLNRPDLTAERFIPNPFSTKPGARLYKSGDKARYLENGEIEYVGRIDNQVKLRGFRIELGEIEAVLNQLPEVATGVVLLREDNLGNPSLVAYLTLQPEQTTTISSLRREMKSKLPEYMVPSAFVILPRLPLTANGKIDRKALPAPDASQLIAEGEYLAPSTPTQEILTGIWQEVLGLKRVGIRDNFFELGGHSLIATRVISQIRQVFKIDLPLRSLFEKPTIVDLAQEIEAATKANLGLETSTIEPVSRTKEIPLSFAQQRLWFLAQLEPDSPFYNQPTAFRLNGELQIPILKQSFQELIDRHETLRTTFAIVEGKPIQVINPAVEFFLPVINLENLDREAQEREIQKLANREAQHPFNLERDSVVRSLLLRLNSLEHIILFTTHHIVCDEWSIAILVKEIATLYETFLEGKPSPLPELPIQYADFAFWQRAWLHGEVLSRQLDYWRKQLQDLPRLDLLTDYPRPAIQSYKGATQSLILSEELSQALKAFSQQQGVTLFMTLLAAFQVLLHRYSNQNDIVVGTPIANRNRAETEGLIGFFVNTLVLRTNLEGDRSFTELLKRVREVTLEAYTHQDIPFEQLVEELKVERHLNRNPLFDVMFTLENSSTEELKLPGLTLSPLTQESKTAIFDLILSISDTEQGLTGAIEYSTDLFDSSAIAQMLAHYQVLLETIVTNPKLRLSQIPLLTAKERDRLLREWNDTEAEYPQDKCIHELFEERVEKAPDAIALVFEDQYLTYRELDNRANQLARYLQQLGVRAEVPVGIYLKRSLEMFVAMLGVLKAGGAYIPIDPTYPSERVATILEDARVGLIVSQSGLETELLSNQTKWINLDRISDLISQHSIDSCLNAIDSENLAYVIYTSGSTGKPKGVAITHQALVNYTLEIIEQFELQGGDRMLQFASIGFDVVVEEIFPTWIIGATVVLPGATELISCREFQHLIEQEQITVFELPTAYWHQWVSELFDSQQTVPSCVRLAIVGGERISPERLRQWQQFSTPLIHVYGLTETTVTSTLYRLNSDVKLLELPIGKAIANTQIYLLDSNLQPVPVGVAGEIYIGGAGIARGYLNRAELTAERFIPNPFSKDAGARLYRTGDLAKYLPDGNIEFLGRIDHQVKVRGFRIELGEIEAVLNQHPQVKECVVINREDVPGENRLIAYIVYKQEKDVTVTELRRFLEEKLPRYLVPSNFVTIDAIPLSSNGKIDRRSLPIPDNLRPELEVDYVRPQTEVQQAIADVWQKVLALEKVGIHDNFFEIGGHSLLLIQVNSKLRQLFNTDLSIVEMFRYPTISSLSEYLNKNAPSQSSLTDSDWQIEKVKAGKAKQKKRRQKVQSI